MEPIVTPGLVLKETRYKESDRIITILTPGLGVISASAQSSLRLKNKLFSACGLFCYSEFVLLPGRNMYTVREAESKNVFHGIASSIEGMSLAMYMAEMAAALSPTGEEAEKELEGKVTVCKLDVDACPIAASKFSVMTIPTLVLFKDGKEVSREIGLMPKQKIIELTHRA